MLYGIGILFNNAYTNEQSMRILVVEDEERLARGITRGLEREGYAVDYITDGEEAQKRIILYQKEYDLIILDLMLPNKDGLEICQNIRSEGVTAPVLILTAKSAIDEKVTLFDSGADDYVVKPFSFKELVARVNALLRRPNEAVPTKLQVANIILDTATHNVYIDEKEVPMTLKEFRLLEYFMRHPNQVLSREDILDHMWDFNFDSFSNVVDVHVKNLRKKLKHGTKKQHLETVRGVGYRFAE